MPPTAHAYVYTDTDSVNMLLSVDGSVARADDNATGSLSGAEAGYVTTAINWATARCNFFLLSKHAALSLSQSWIVSRWCAIVAAYYLSCRRGNPAAGSLRDLYDECIEDMKLVQSGEVTLSDTALRSAAWPAWSNVRVFVDGLRKVRVESPISETRGGRPTEYNQHTDRSADHIVEFT